MRYFISLDQNQTESSYIIQVRAVVIQAIFIKFKTTFLMEQAKPIDKRKNLENLRSKTKLDLKSALTSIKSKTEISQNSSENSSFSIQEYYRLGEKIGEGAHGVVKKVFEVSSGELFAVKILRADQQKIQAVKQNFLMCRVLKHPSIIQHHQLFIDRQKQQVFLIMEYCPYPTLHSIFKNINSRAQIAHLLKTLLEAVCELHKNGICHRDLKLQNILYDRSTGKLKIIDLGISKLLFNRKTNQKQTMWSVTGTTHYKAPEMFQGFEYDEKVDAWALGIIAYQLAYGKLPFNSQFQMTLISQILRKQPIFQQSNNSDDNLLISFIQGLLKKNPERRMNCFEALRHPFIQHSQIHTRMFRYQDIFHLDSFSSKVSRSQSLELSNNSSRGSSVESRRAPDIKQLRLTLISDSHRIC